MSEKENILVLHRNLEGARMLRLWLSHGQLPPLGRVLGCLSAYVSVLEAVGCPKETVRRIRSLLVNLRSASLSGRSPFPVANFPKECVHGGIILSAFIHAEKSLEEVCQELDHNSLAAFKSERKHTRPMELTDFLKFIQRQAKDTLTGLDGDFNERFLKPFIIYRNHLFHHDRLPPTEKTLAFWERLMELLQLLHWDTTLRRATEIIRLLDQTKAWLNEKHAPPPCCIELPSDSCRLSNWIIGPTDILEGRSDETEQVIDSLKKPGKPIWIYGPSGVGKTHLAANVSSQLRQTHPVQHFFQSTSQQTLVESLFQFVESNGIELGDIGEKFDDLIMCISRFLREANTPMLLLFDDVKKSQLVAPLVTDQPHHVVITSLSNPPPSDVLPAHVIRLDPLCTADSLKVMVNVKNGAKSATRQSQWPDIDDGREWLSLLGVESTSSETINDHFTLLKNLLETTLCNLPLAVNIAGHLMAKGISVEKIASSLANVADSIASGKPRIIQIEETSGHAAHALAVSGLGYLALAQLAEDRSAHFFAFTVACTANPRVPLSLLEEAMHSKSATSPVETLTTLGRLQEFGILEVTNDTAVSIHPLMQGFLVDILFTERQFMSLLLHVIVSLALYFPDKLKTRASPHELQATEWRTAALCAGQFADISVIFLHTLSSRCHHVHSVEVEKDNASLLKILEHFHKTLGDYHLDIFQNHPTDPRVAKAQTEIALEICKMTNGLCHIKAGELFHQLAMAQNSLCDAREAKVFYLRALSIFEQHFGQNHVQLATTINNLGNAAMDLGDAREAKVFYLRALSIKEQHLGQNHVQLATTINNLGTAAMDLGDAREAKVFYLRALSIFEQHFGQNHVKLATTINNLGEAALRLGDAHEAKVFYLRALSIKEQHFGQNHVQLAGTITNLGSVAMDLGDAREAKVFYLRALSIFEQHFGQNHVQLADTINNLGNAARELGDAHEAKVFYLRALSIFEQHFGQNHVRLATTINNLGNAAMDLGNAHEAKVFYLRALSIKEQHFGQNHVQLATTIDNLGTAAMDLGDAREAKVFYLRALSIFEQHFGQNHVQLAITINNLGNVAMDLGDAREAKVFYLRALSIKKQHFGQNHVQLADTINNLGNAARQLGDAHEAKVFYLRALSIFEQHFGQNHVQLADTINNLGNAAMDLGDAHEAKVCYLRSISIKEQHFGQNHVQLAGTINNLGNAAMHLGDAREAKVFYLRALSIKEQHFGQNHVQLADTINNLGNVAMDLGDAREAKDFYLRALSIFEQHFGQNHVKLADTINNLGNAALHLGDARVARVFYLRALSIEEQHFGQNHVKLATTFNNLGNVAMCLGDAFEAKVFYLRALSIKEQHFRQDGRAQLIDTMNNLALVFLRLGDSSEALRLYDRVRLLSKGGSFGEG